MAEASMKLMQNTAGGRFLKVNVNGKYSPYTICMKEWVKVTTFEIGRKILMLLLHHIDRWVWQVRQLCDYSYGFRQSNLIIM